MNYFQPNISGNKTILKQSKAIKLVLLIITLELLLFPFPGFADNLATKNLLEEKIANIEENLIAIGSA